MSLPGCSEASTRPRLHTRRSSRFRSSSIGPCKGSIVPEGREGGARLRADRRGVGQGSCGVGDDEDRRTTRSPDVGEKNPYLSTPNNISHVFYPGVYPIGMARGDIARTYQSAWPTTSSSPRWLVLHPRASELLAIYGRGTSLGPRLGRSGAGLGGGIDVDEELCKRGENVDVHLGGCVWAFRG